MAAMTEATVQQPATTTREQIWLNREQVRKEKPVYRALKRVQDVFFSLLALIVLSPLMLIVALAIVTLMTRKARRFLRRCAAALTARSSASTNSAPCAWTLRRSWRI